MTGPKGGWIRGSPLYYLDSSKELLDVCHVPLEIEGDHATEPFGLRLHQLVLGMGGEAGKDDLLDEGGGLHELGHGQRVPLVFPHADVQGFQATVGEVRVEGAGNAPRCCAN